MHNQRANRKRKGRVMIRIASTRISGHKRVPYGLTAIYGVGLSTAKYLCQKLEINPLWKIQDLTVDQLTQLTEAIPNLTGVALKRQKQRRKEELKLLNCYRGLRLAKGLPVRGQKTKHNAKTARKRLS